MSLINTSIKPFKAQAFRQAIIDGRCRLRGSGRYSSFIRLTLQPFARPNSAMCQSPYAPSCSAFDHRGLFGLDKHALHPQGLATTETIGKISTR